MPISVPVRPNEGRSPESHRDPVLSFHAGQLPLRVRFEAWGVPCRFYEDRPATYSSLQQWIEEQTFLALDPL